VVILLLKVSENRIRKISKDKFKYEKDLQQFIEENLGSLLGLELVKSEFSIENYRFDTLAFDKENNAFVIIEYKRGSSYSVIDQGYSYLASMLNNKAEVILEFNESLGRFLKRNEVEWSQSKIIFISQGFTKFQKDSLNFKDLPIELYEVKRYEGGLLSFEEIKGKKNSESIKTIAPSDGSVDKVTKEIKSFTLEDHYQNSKEDIIELFKVFKEKIEEMILDIEIEPKKLYIAFKSDRKNVVDIRLQKNSLKIWLNARQGTIKDAEGITKDVSNTGHWGNGDYELSAKDDDNLEYILSLIKQVYRLNK